MRKLESLLNIHYISSVAGQECPVYRRPRVRGEQAGFSNPGSTKRKILSETYSTFRWC